MALSYLTAGLPGVGGTLKQEPEDFVVDELPLYEMSGVGEHTFLHIWKRGLASFEAMRRVAGALHVDERTISYAGLKDARAITTQWLSVPRVDPAAARGLELDGVRILDARRHGNRLKIGHLRGNRFRIVVRGVGPDGYVRASAILDRLVRRGAPNYYGAQRFGSRGDSHKVGEAILRRDYRLFVERLIGGAAGPERDPHLLQSRELFNAGRIEEAYEAMPLRRRPEKKCLHALLRFGTEERAYFAVPQRMRRLYAASYQSSLFNLVLDRRIDDQSDQEIDRLAAGDLALLHRTKNKVFLVERADEEQARCRAFEISPSGPIFGLRTLLAEGQAGAIERQILADTGLDETAWNVGGGIKLKGTRRSLRIPLREVELDRLDDGSLRVGFTLPPGCFATSVLREMMKPHETA